MAESTYNFFFNQYTYQALRTHARAHARAQPTPI